jgi:hypothetical protein
MAGGRPEARSGACGSRSARAVWVCLVAGLVSVLASCNPGNNGVNDPGMNMTGEMGTVDPPDMAMPLPPCGEDSKCPMGRICYMGQCIPDYGGCCSDEDCQNDTYCSVKNGSPDGGMSCGICLQYKDGERDPMCIGNGFSAAAFKPPVDRCKWPPAGAMPPARDVVMTPLVIDLDGDNQPEIVFGPQSMSGPMRLVAIRGGDCSVLYDVAANLESFSQLAAGDLDGDKRPEIVGLLSSGTASTGHYVGVFNGMTGALIAQSSEPFKMSGASFDCSAPAIADLDGDGSPEVVVGGLSLRYNKARRTLDTIQNITVPAATWGTATLVNDMDGDGKPEVISGTKIYNPLATPPASPDKTPSIMATLGGQGGYPAIGDFNLDGSPDLVLVQSTKGDQRVSVIDVKNNRFLMPITSIAGGWGGPPTVADFDGDGVPDFGTSGPQAYYVFSLDCLKTPKPAKCRGSIPGTLWVATIKDISSGGTASSVFDFNGDGRAEVVYRDECWLRVFNGPDGKTVFARPITSGTALEMPVVADVDNDGHADLVVPSDPIQMPGYCMDQNPERETGMAHTGVTQGLFVLKDPMNRWMPSRPMWNQHTYHITNINDDTTIPAVEPKNWTSYNNYRQNVQGTIVMPVPQPDTTGKGTPAPEQKDCSLEWMLYAKVCNRGAADTAPNMPNTFYLRDPRTAPDSALCTAYTAGPIQPGKCEIVSCAWTNPPPAPVDLWLRVNDDGKGGRPQTQCKNLNDLAFLPGVNCQRGPG